MKEQFIITVEVITPTECSHPVTCRIVWGTSTNIARERTTENRLTEIHNSVTEAEVAVNVLLLGVTKLITREHRSAHQPTNIILVCRQTG